MLLLPLLLLGGLVAGNPLPLNRREETGQNAINDVLDALNTANLTSLANFFVSHPNVLQQVMVSPGLKTILAPTNKAMDGIPDWCTNNQDCYEGTILMHVLNGSFAVNLLQQGPKHTIGHSFLVNKEYTNLPGGNGQVVTMSQVGGYDSDDEGVQDGNGSRSEDAAEADSQDGDAQKRLAWTPSVTSSDLASLPFPSDPNAVTDASLGPTQSEYDGTPADGRLDIDQASDIAEPVDGTRVRTTPRAEVNEALNNDAFSVSDSKDRSGNYTIQPIHRAMTIPGTATSTLNLTRRFSTFAQLLQSQPGGMSQTIDQMRGVTIFAPSNAAIRQFQDNNANMSADDLQAVILNHLVAHRAVYSPLLADQGSMVTMGGQDVVFQTNNNTLTVGQAKAGVTQFDIIHMGGVIHGIDAVLDDSNKDLSRAFQASQSASASANSFVAGPVSVQNADSSQGADVPASQPGGPADKANANSTVQTTDATHNGTEDGSLPGITGSGSSTGAAANVVLPTTLALLLATLTALVTLSL